MDKSWKELLIELIEESDADERIFEYLFWFVRAKIKRGK